MDFKPTILFFRKFKKVLNRNVSSILINPEWLNWEEWIKFDLRNSLTFKSRKTQSLQCLIPWTKDWWCLTFLMPSIRYLWLILRSKLIDIFVCSIIWKITAMNQDSFSCESLEEENIISRASPKSYEQSNQAGRSRFSILSDINDANIPNKKTEEQSLLSKYMRDLHDEQAENPIKNNNNQPNREYRNDQNNK